LRFFGGFGWSGRMLRGMGEHVCCG
jgi:hypothetical protein